MSFISEAESSNTVKQDLETLCKSFQAVESQFTQFIDKLEHKSVVKEEANNKNCTEKAASNPVVSDKLCASDNQVVVDESSDNNENNSNVINDSAKDVIDDNADNVESAAKEDSIETSDHQLESNYEECTVNLTLTIPR